MRGDTGIFSEGNMEERKMILCKRREKKARMKLRMEFSFKEVQERRRRERRFWWWERECSE